MIHGLVTVGTTPFDSLIKSVDKPSSIVRLCIQTAASQYCPQNHEFKRYIQDIESVYDDVDFIIAHAGAGTVYKLLERGKRIVVVPNLDRSDHHQSELAEYVREQRFAIVMSSEQIDSIGIDCIAMMAMEFSYEPYSKEEFFVADEIVRFLRS